MFYVGRDNSIKITRSDTAVLKVELTDINGKTYTMASGDKLKFTVKGSVIDTESLIQITVTGSNIININSSHTQNLNFGIYKYDIELNTSTGKVFTVIPCNNFEICEEVG